MGIGNFFDNFMGGLAFGMLAGLSFGRWSGGCCGFGFPMMGGFGYQTSQFDYIFDNSYQNSFPSIDYSVVLPSIWDCAKQTTENYFRSMQSNSNNSSIPLSKNNQQISFYSMPFSGYYLPSSLPVSYLTGYMPTNTSKVVDKANDLEPKETDAEKAQQKKDEKALTERKERDNSSREFASVYQELGITDKRFQKIFEECVLGNEGRERGKDVYSFDVVSMNKNGVLQGTYDSYRKRKNLPKQDVKNMTLKEMCDIYYNDFYVAGGANSIKDDRLSLYVFDSDVNMGVGTGKKLLSKSKNNPAKFEEERRIEYSKRKNFSTYGEGWYNRVAKVKAYADSNFTTTA